MRYAALAGINQGIMTTLLALQTLFVAVIFYCFFDEQLGLKFIIGMLMLKEPLRVDAHLREQPAQLRLEDHHQRHGHQRWHFGQ